MKKVVVQIMMKNLEVKQMILPLCRAESYILVMKQKGFECQIVK